MIGKRTIHPSRLRFHKRDSMIVLIPARKSNSLSPVRSFFSSANLFWLGITGKSVFDENRKRKKTPSRGEERFGENLSPPWGPGGRKKRVFKYLLPPCGPWISRFGLKRESAGWPVAGVGVRRKRRFHDPTS